MTWVIDKAHENQTFLKGHYQVWHTIYNRDFISPKLVVGVVPSTMVQIFILLQKTSDIYSITICSIHLLSQDYVNEGNKI